MKYRAILLILLFACLHCGPKYKRHNFIWEKQYDFNRESDRAYEVVISGKGDLFVLGSCREFSEKEFKLYWILKKFSSKGRENNNWNKKIKINFFDPIARLAADKNDNIYVVGQGYGTLNEERYSNWWVKKYLPDANEDVEHWGNKIIQNDSLYLLSAIDVDNKNNLYVGGRDRVEIEELRKQGDEEELWRKKHNELWWIKKYNENGVEDVDNWDKKNDNGNDDSLAGITMDKKNNVYLSGSGEKTVDGKQEYYSWIRKYDEYGIEDKNWDKRFGFGDDFFHSIIILIDSDNNVYAAGTFRNNSNDDKETLRIKKFSEDGIEDKKWDKKYFRDDSFFLAAAIIDKYNNIYVAGYGYNLVSASSENDMWIRKIGFDGQEDLKKWDKKIDGKKSIDESLGITVDTFNDVYVVGNGMNLIAELTKKDIKMLLDPNVSLKKAAEIQRRASSDDWWILKFRGER